MELDAPTHWLLLSLLAAMITLNIIFLVFLISQKFSATPLAGASGQRGTFVRRGILHLRNFEITKNLQNTRPIFKHFCQGLVQQSVNF